ncbi:multiple epidermal growth factor-like domains protein 8 isoform X2 [Condylostylus longicornis]|uniref:multiple epidermal growth factor-like domains protein 8 isoform X2 n=1 Tax=Condylostylus longicornis TaxID=2530218 RepID=UPI00244E06CC|nr:multiple epidermal growth factor-like domains protein 8 isoform X2 [Condylostylus longicornis]
MGTNILRFYLYLIRLIGIYIFCKVIIICNVQAENCDKTRKVLTSNIGEISHGSNANYTQDSHCEWLIKAQNSSQFITLKFHSMATECSYDYIFVYDGDSFNSKLLGSFSGRTEPQKLVATSGNMLILLYSDTNYVLEGFHATYYISNCLNNCNNNGKCIGHHCVCHGEWLGPDCENQACPDRCGEDFGRGKCVHGICQCNEHFSGRYCDLKKYPLGNNWHWLASENEGFTKRASHTAIYLEERDALYVFGGYDLNNVLSSLEIYNFSKSRWEDEWGIPLQNRFHNNYTSKIDNTLLKAVLSNKNKDEAKLWGLKTDASFFKYILYTLAESNITANNITNEDLATVIDDILEDVTDNRPDARYGHAATKISSGFIIFGGKLSNGSFSNELWFYNASRNGGEWMLRAKKSKLYPPPLTRHTLTAVGEYLYVFGGSLESGEYSSKIFRIRFSLNSNEEQWQEVYARGGKTLDLRLVAHTTVYYQYTHSLIIYGGIMTNLARFSKLSDRIFAFQLDELHWTEILYPRTALRDTNIPHERAFHSATIAGNYMIVFGGYTHRHNKEETCYDNQMYFYHLGCHTWINQEISSSPGSHYPKKQGVFAHATSVRLNNTLLIVGGYHGNVNADLFAYELPQILRVKDPTRYLPERFCHYHLTQITCLSDPECGWCSADSSCYGRTIGANCTTNLQTTRCPGICPSLGDCHSCLVHGSIRLKNFPDSYSIANKLGLNQCSWCVQNAKCHQKDNNFGVCGEPESQITGWWGKRGTEVINRKRCTFQDRRPGLTYIKYNYPVNYTMPDYVAIVNATMADFSPTSYDRNSAKMVARLIGYVRPQGNETLDMCVSYASLATLKTGIGNVQEHKSKTTTMIDVNQTTCKLVEWTLSEPFFVDFTTKPKESVMTKTNMELRHYGTTKALTFEYLEPYSYGKCNIYKNCLHCLTDMACGWCDLTNKCLPRNITETLICKNEYTWHYLIIQPPHCANCSNYINCEDCIETEICEWLSDEAKCSRIGRSQAAVRLGVNTCPVQCKLRTNCLDCLNQQGRCVWCEATEQCFSFSVYTSEYQFGICREWLDKSFSNPNIENVQNITSVQSNKCRTCSQHKNCVSCLKNLGCGWCFNKEKPIDGACMREWAYSHCPDVDECALKIDSCSQNAECINTDGSYECHCRRGFIGNGRTECKRTCFEKCQNGVCSGSPGYECQCFKGWTGVDCSIDCGCYNHSTCVVSVGICDQCEDWTEGEHCERCRPGSYGNATSSEGCSPCSCNNHGNKNLGLCDRRTGQCFCQDNTGGFRCEVCNAQYYGDPTIGQCYYQCENRGILTQLGVQGLGSHQSYKAPWGGREIDECLWLITPKKIKEEPVIQIDIEWENLNVKCDNNAIYIYDSLPDLSGNIQQGQLISIVCSPYSAPVRIETKSKHVSVYYNKGGDRNNGFKAIYKVMNCDDNKICGCPTGWVGSKCEKEICPKNCTENGHCNHNYGICICNSGYGGTDCSTKIESSNLVVTELFNTIYLGDNFEHLRKTIPRFGHSLNADKRGSLWMFGGYSLSNGPLNDIRQFDTKNGTWMQVTVESEPNDKMPQGRYFHASEISLSKQVIYVYGGLTSYKKGQPNQILKDFWQFSIQNQRWDEIETTVESIINGDKPPSLAGHTLTYLKIGEKESLLLIGGISSNFDMIQLQLWEFEIETNRWQRIKSSGAKIPALFGHSAAFHGTSSIVYVFGGYAENRSQNKLYALDLKEMKWAELPVFSELYAPESILPLSRYFHSAITTEFYMIVFGGRTYPYSSTDILNAYIFECNSWVKLTEQVKIIGNLPSYTYGEGMTIDQETKSVYIVGGWDGTSQSRVTKIQLPEDLCQLWSSTKAVCRHHIGCSFCNITNDAMESTHFCFRNGNNICHGREGTLSYNHGALCDASWIARRNCSTFSACSACLAFWPLHEESTSVCQWCESYNTEGKCLPANIECPNSQGYNKSITINKLEKCLPECQKLDCETCSLYSDHCQWAVVKDIRVTECIKKELIEKNFGNYKVLTKCPMKCEEFKSCKSCLSIESENYLSCKWSTALHACINPNIQPLYCAGGVCGLVLDSMKDIDQCPSSCYFHNQCSLCLRHANCGWCSKEGSNGDGVCVEGLVENYSSYQPTTDCNNHYASFKNLSVDVLKNDKFVWNYLTCPLENECNNNHHQCNPTSQRCLDIPVGYKCVCAEGYRDENGICIPVCKLGCENGECVSPDDCKCNFGYVGPNCSIACECNGHSDCSGPDQLSECLYCHNNTMGLQCEKCKPLFVGNPKNKTSCVPCKEYCHGHTDVCVSKDEEILASNMSRNQIEKNLKEGPKANAVCMNCGNQTDGERCETCVLGYFRGSYNMYDICRPCECHGHGDICDRITGEKCNCGNNTESDSSCMSGNKNSAQQCWSFQCSKCKDSYAGNPVDGHQCYKQISVEVRMCFDALPIEQCKLKPSPLRPGQTVFFVIQPRFMNVDIRIMIDVTQGELDVFMSPQDDSFVVLNNQSNEYHELFLDNKYRWVTERDSDLTEPLNIVQPKFDNTTNTIVSQKLWTPSIRDCKSLDGEGFYVKDQRAKDLSTYITLNQCNTVLRLFNLKNRLVLTLPQTAHNLSATRFFIALRSNPNAEGSYGSIVFRQDQLHIDLFVFFSVFFSCFFLFLAVCVVAWKAKQAADMRRARQRHVDEMLHMAQRPFSSIFVTIPPYNKIDYGDYTPMTIRKGRHRLKSATQSSATVATSAPNSTSFIRPLAFEPTSDNIAWVGTVLISLPGKYKAPVGLALGSTLITLPRQYPLIIQYPRHINKQQQQTHYRSSHLQPVSSNSILASSSLGMAPSIQTQQHTHEMGPGAMELGDL